MASEPSVSISWAEPKNADALIPLLSALHQHDVPEISEPSRDVLITHVNRLLDPANAHRLVIACDQNGEAVGLAAVAIFISISDPRLGHYKQMELKELFVRPESRGARVGEALLAWVEKEAMAVNAHRIDWHVKRDNHRGIAFYQRHGATIVENRLSMRKVL